MSVLVVLQFSKLFIIVFWNIFWNVVFRNKHFEKTALMPSMPQLVVTNTYSIFQKTSFDIYYRYCWSPLRTLAHIITVYQTHVRVI